MAQTIAKAVLMMVMVMMMREMLPPLRWEAVAPEVEREKIALEKRENGEEEEKEGAPIIVVAEGKVGGEERVAEADTVVAARGKGPE